MSLSLSTNGDLTSIGEQLRVEETLPQTRSNLLDPEGDPEVFTEFRLYRLEPITDAVQLAETTDTERWILKSVHETRDEAINAALVLAGES